MATGVKPRDDETKLTRVDLEAIQDAMKSKKFRDLLNEYCEEVRDPANQAIYQKEMIQLEKERGYDVTFINPKGGYVIKTSVAGDRKAFINICSNDNVDKPSCSVQEVNGQRGMNWQLPYSVIPPREDIDKNKQRCVIYDVVFHSDTLRMASVNKRFRELVNKTAFEGLQNTYHIHFDDNNCRFPKLQYKGMSVPAVIRKEDPNFIPTEDEQTADMSPELLDKLYPQKVYSEEKNSLDDEIECKIKSDKTYAKKNNDFIHVSSNGYTIPKYVVKQQKDIDIQDYTYDKKSKKYAALPSHIVVEITLPLLSSTKDCILDVKDKSLNLISEKPAKYKLDLMLPYSVNEECGSAKFDKTKHLLIISLPVHKENFVENIKMPIRADSGIESENNSFDEDKYNKKLIEEIQSSPIEPDLNQIIVKNNEDTNNNEFFQSSISYLLPSYTYNILDDVLAFTFHIKNTEPSSVQVKNNDNKVYIKFSTIGSGFVPMYYAAIIIFDDDVKFTEVAGEAWDNNVILQLELSSSMPQGFYIGVSNENMREECFDLTQIKKTQEAEGETNEQQCEETSAVVKVENSQRETNILVSSSKCDDDENTLETEREIVWINSRNNESGAKSILRKSIGIRRSCSESSYGDVASSMDYISSDCIPEESSFKKTVRFSNVIARQFYRYNSSIEGQKRKNQKRKTKKRNHERRRSESEAESDTPYSAQLSKPRSALKQRRDSGVDTSDAEGDLKYTMSDSEVTYGKIKYSSENTNDITENGQKQGFIVSKHKDGTEKEIDSQAKRFSNDKSLDCDDIKHDTIFYDPSKLNKGQYQEIKFKNDLIFDLDM